MNETNEKGGKLFNSVKEDLPYLQRNLRDKGYFGS